MTKSRPTYSIEFKNDAAYLVLDKGYTITEACQPLCLDDARKFRIPRLRINKLFVSLFLRLIHFPLSLFVEENTYS
jgi:hypothetical protein